jgi:hypothetical protein
MSELSLNDDEWDTLAGHLDGVRMPELTLVPTSAQHHYADLRVTPKRRGEMLQIADLAVGKIGIIHVRWRDRSINDAREQQRGQRRSSLQSAAR